MELPQYPSGISEVEPTPRREALRQIIEVFHNGQLAAADLRDRLDGMTPRQLQSEIEAIEATMLSQISSICTLAGENGAPPWLQ
ncbi:MAG: hypothetical protein ACO1SX_02740 [Actinomycetota bacterium]